MLLTLSAQSSDFTEVVEALRNSRGRPTMPNRISAALSAIHMGRTRPTPYTAQNIARQLKLSPEEERILHIAGARSAGWRF